MLFILVAKAWSKKRRASATARRLAGLARACVVVVVLLTILSVAAARRASAEVARTATRLGKDLMPLVEVLGGSSTIAVNGQKILLKYDGSKMSVKEVLDAAERACREGGVQADTFDAKANAGERQRASERLLRVVDFGVMRSNDDREGAVLCFARGARTPATFADQLDELSRSGDLGSLGKMRYVYARVEGDGTAVLAAVTEDSFDLRALRAAPDDDSPGSDDPSLPRPAGSVRFLSAVLEGTPYATRGYRTKVSAEEVRRTFDAGMLDRGFAALEIETKDGTKGNAYLKNGVMVTLAVSRERNGDTLVSVGSLGADDRRTAR